jgi:hypothetical protein
MNEHFFLKGQRVITPEGPGEVTDAIGNKIFVKLDKGLTKTFTPQEVHDDSDAG